VGGLLVVFHGSALPVLRFAGGSLARDLCEIRLRQLQHRPRTDCHAGRPDTRCHATELERIETNQTRLIEERAQLQDELQEARAEAGHAKADQVRMARDVATMFDELAQTQQLCHQPPNDWRRLNTSILRSGRSEMAVLLTFRLLGVGSTQAGKSRFALIRISLFLQNELSVKSLLCIRTSHQFYTIFT
jgi:hypothetical protein